LDTDLKNICGSNLAIKARPLPFLGYIGSNWQYF